MPKAPPQGLLVTLLLAQIAFGLLAMTICLPSMQEWGAIFGSDQAGVQLTFSGFVLALGAMQMVYGPLSDRHGRKRILLAGLALACAGSLLGAFAPDLASLIAARVVQGAGSAAGLVTGRAMVQDLFTGPRRTQVMAYVGMVMGLCPPLAIIVGGQIHVRLGWQANFVLIAITALVMLLAAWRLLPDPAQGQAPHTPWLADMLSAYRRLAREPVFLLFVAVLCLTTGVFHAFLSGAPIVLRGLGVGPDGVGWYMMVVPLSYIAGNYLASRLVHRLGERRLMAWGQGSSLCGIGLMTALGLTGFSSALSFSLPLILLGIGHGLLMPPALSGTVGLIPALAGSAAALTGLAQQWMAGLSGYSVGLLPDGPVYLGLLMLGMTVAALLAQLPLFRRWRPGHGPGSMPDRR
jgi:DHA1 family bicyclomycin/chloramphenicol resistance-like MFS transporter